MPISRTFAHLVCASLLLSSSGKHVASAERPESPADPQKLSYRIEWRLVTAGTANLAFTHPSGNGWQIDLDIESAGLVTRLYKVADKYKVISNDRFCPATVDLDAEEGKRHTITHLGFDQSRHKVSYDERDLVRNAVHKKELDIPPCTHEIAGALAALAQMNLEPGHSAYLPVTDGKKVVSAKIEALAKETVNIDGKSYPTIRYEAFLFDNVLYKRKGRLFLWLTDDPDKTAVQFRIQLGFPIGTISLELEKQQKL